MTMPLPTPEQIDKARLKAEQAKADRKSVV